MFCKLIYIKKITFFQLNIPPVRKHHLFFVSLHCQTRQSIYLQSSPRTSSVKCSIMKKSNKKFSVNLNEKLYGVVIYGVYVLSDDGHPTLLYAFPSRDLASRYIATHDEPYRYYISEIDFAGEFLVNFTEYCANNK